MPRCGFCTAVIGVLRVVPSGLITMGPPCSSYVWVNRSTAKRSPDNPYGDEGRDYVLKGTMKLNCMFYIYIQQNNEPFSIDIYYIPLFGIFLFMSSYNG